MFPGKRSGRFRRRRCGVAETDVLATHTDREVVDMLHFREKWGRGETGAVANRADGVVSTVRLVVSAAWPLHIPQTSTTVPSVARSVR